MQTTIETLRAADTTYNGWRNRATWLVNLWLSNEEPYYRKYRAASRELKKAHTSVRRRLADLIRADVIDGDVPTGFYTDLHCTPLQVNGKLAKVDWIAIADTFLEG